MRIEKGEYAIGIALDAAFEPVPVLAPYMPLERRDLEIILDIHRHRIGELMADVALYHGNRSTCLTLPVATRVEWWWLAPWPCRHAASHAKSF